MDEWGTCNSCGCALGRPAGFCEACGAPVVRASVGSEGFSPRPPPSPRDRTVRLASLPADGGESPIGAGTADRPVPPPPPLHPPPLPPVAAQRMQFADVDAPSDSGGPHRRGRALWLGAGIGALAAVVVIALGALVAWAVVGSRPPDGPSAVEAAPTTTAANEPVALPTYEAIAARLLPAADIPAPSGGPGAWSQVGEFRRTFEAGKAYDRCTGSPSPADGRRVSHEYRFGSDAVFATEAVTAFAADGAAVAFYDAEGRAIPGCNEADTVFAPVTVPETDAASMSTSGTARVVRMRKGLYVVTVTADPTVDWQSMAAEAASRLR